MKKSDCQFYCKGGWCGKTHRTIIEKINNQESSRIERSRCSELHKAMNDKCNHYRLRETE